MRRDCVELFFARSRFWRMNRRFTSSMSAGGFCLTIFDFVRISVASEWGAMRVHLHASTLSPVDVVPAVVDVAEKAGAAGGSFRRAMHAGVLYVGDSDASKAQSLVADAVADVQAGADSDACFRCVFVFPLVNRLGRGATLECRRQDFAEARRPRHACPSLHRKS